MRPVFAEMLELRPGSTTCCVSGSISSPGPLQSSDVTDPSLARMYISQEEMCLRCQRFHKAKRQRVGRSRGENCRIVRRSHSHDEQRERQPGEDIDPCDAPSSARLGCASRAEADVPICKRRASPGRGGLLELRLGAVRIATTIRAPASLRVRQQRDRSRRASCSNPEQRPFAADATDLPARPSGW